MSHMSCHLFNEGQISILYIFYTLFSSEVDEWDQLILFNQVAADAVVGWGWLPFREMG